VEQIIVGSLICRWW